MSLQNRLSTAFAQIGRDIKALRHNAQAQRLASQTLFIYDFTQSGVIADWRNYQGGGERVINQRSLQVGNNIGNDEIWADHRDLIPVKKGAIYKISARIKRSHGTGIFYLGVTGVKSDKVTLVNLRGYNTHSSQHYAVSAHSPASDWEVVTGHLATHDTPLTGYANPRTLHSNVTYLRPLFIANYPSRTGITYIDWIKLQVL